MPNVLEDIPRVSIIGTGLLGASVGLGLKAVGYAGRITGVGRRTVTLEAARQRGAIDDFTTDVREGLSRTGLAVVAVPLGGFDAVFSQIAELGPDQPVVTDVGSTKLRVAQQARARLPHPERFVGAHPMAGSEQQGPEAAQADLFQGKVCILTPAAEADARAVRVVEALWQALGMRLIRLDALEHDQQTAATSHLPHLAAVMLVRTAMKLGGWDVASTGFRDTTRLASSNPPMRADILANNREQVLRALTAFEEEVRAMRACLTDGEREPCLEALQEAKAARERWLSETFLDKEPRT